MTNEKRYIYTSTRSVSIKPDRKVASGERILSIKSHHHPQWSYETIVKWKIKKRYISIYSRLIAGKLDKVMNYNDWWEWISNQEFCPWSVKSNTWHILDFPEAVGNNIKTSSPFNAVVIVCFFIFDISIITCFL